MAPLPPPVPLSPQQLALLGHLLEKDFVPHLPKLIDATKLPDEQMRKNRSRALSAFALHKLCDLSPKLAAAAVVDDFEDCGIDAIYFEASSGTLYLVQTKLKSGQEFQQAEAQKLIAGVRKLVQADLTGFNAHVTARGPEIIAAVEECNQIQVVVAYVGERISAHARSDIDALINDPDSDERRYRAPFIDYGPARILSDLRSSRSHARINPTLVLMKAKSIEEPRLTYFGLVWLKELVALYQTHGDGLFDRNIRNHLGDKTPVNAEIRATLLDRPLEFFYLNNGVTALASVIDTKNTHAGGTRLELRDFSVINGAQTIATAAGLATSSSSADLVQAKIALTIIKADADGEFGKRVTRARNHQNPVPLSGFAALDDQQEVLRRELEMLGFRYRYKIDTLIDVDPSIIRFEEAVAALALLDGNPRNVWKLRERPDDLRTFGQPGYEALFSPRPSAFRVANVVLVSRFLLGFMREAISSAAKPEQDIYRHGYYAHAWVLAKRARAEIDGTKILVPESIASGLGPAADQLRETLRELVDASANAPGGKAAWAQFRNQNDSINLLERLMLRHYAVGEDAALASKRSIRPVRTVRGRQVPLYDYPQPLFSYLATKAPQIADLT